MNREPLEQSEAAKSPRRIPLWLRIVLMGLLILFAAAAFYINNLKIIEYLENR